MVDQEQKLNKKFTNIVLTLDNNKNINYNAGMTKLPAFFNGDTNMAKIILSWLMLIQILASSFLLSTSIIMIIFNPISAIMTTALFVVLHEMNMNKLVDKYKEYE